MPEFYVKILYSYLKSTFRLSNCRISLTFATLSSLYDGINNVTAEATLINQFRVTLAQILGGGAVAIGIYFAWTNFIVAQETLEFNQRNAQDNLKVAKEGQITERFTRAVEQLGNDKIEIRLGGIYALERISNESEKDYWPIMEILTAYVRNNSPIKTGNVISKDIKNQNKVSLDIQAILTVIGRRKYSYFTGEPTFLDMHETCLQEAIFRRTNLEVAFLMQANLKWAFLVEADLEEANLTLANLEGANLEEANLKGADLEEANLKGAKNLTLNQLSKVKTLYNAKLDDELRIPLEKEHPELFKAPKRVSEDLE